MSDWSWPAALNRLTRAVRIVSVPFDLQRQIGQPPTTILDVDAA